jgi:hypothetical protein
MLHSLLSLASSAVRVTCWLACSWLQITKTADGYQPHLVSPERGLQLMASKALDQVEGPVQVRKM